MSATVTSNRSPVAAGTISPNRVLKNSRGVWRTTPMRPKSYGQRGASAALALLDDRSPIACVAPPHICPYGARNGTPGSSSALC